VAEENKRKTEHSFDQKFNKSNEALRNTVVADVKMSTEDMNTDCNSQERCERMSQENLQMEDCKIDNALDQNVLVLADKRDGKTVAPEVWCDFARLYYLIG
jgi:hypothetical protein